jgi:hypothetical protein
MTEPSADDVASRLHQVTDGVTPREECIGWLIAEMRNGADPNALAAELVANGWVPDDAAKVVDEACSKAREFPSVLRTRDRIAHSFAESSSMPSLRAEGMGGVIAYLVLGIAYVFQWFLSRDTRRIRRRIKLGLCYQCGNNVNAREDQCPQCGTANVRRVL